MSGNAPNDYAFAKTMAARSLKFRPRSEQEIVNKLKDKKVSAKSIEKVCALLKKQGLVNDQLFTRGWITSRLKKPLGLARIRRELKQKGISDELITQESQMALEGYDEIIAARELAQRRIKSYKGIDKLKIKQRLYGYLVRRGFRFESVQRVINNL